MNDKPEDVGDEEQVKDRKISAKLAREEDVECLRAMTETYEGRSVLWRILGQCLLFQPSYTGEANGTFVNEGKRNIGLWLVDEVFTSNPNAYTMMTDEAVSRDTKRGKRN